MNYSLQEERATGLGLDEYSCRGNRCSPHLDPASALAVGLLIFALLMVVIFEATNGFHDAANAVATVIYTKSLLPLPRLWCGPES